MNKQFMFTVVYLFFSILASPLLGATDSLRVEKVISSDWSAYVHFPSSHKLLPAIIVLGGAEGGFPFTVKEAQSMVKEGFIIMRLSYFKYSKKTKKQKLKEIRIEKVIEAITWLKKNTLVDSTKIGLLGISKGAELALIVASKSNAVKAVAAHVPSHVVWCGIGKWMALNKSSWTWQGEPIAFMPYAKPKSGWFTKRLAEFYESGIKTYPERIALSAISVENIAGPILLSSGGKDDIWPSAFMASEIEKRLFDKKIAYEVKHLNFPEAGHLLFGRIQGQNDENSLNTMSLGGGSLLSNNIARQQTWHETFTFFRKALNK